MSSLDAASHQRVATSPTRARLSGSSPLASTLQLTTPTAPHGRTTRPCSAMTAWPARQACSPTWRTTGRRLPPSTSSSWSSSSSSTPSGAARSGTIGRTTRTRPGNEVRVAKYRLLGYVNDCISVSWARSCVSSKLPYVLMCPVHVTIDAVLPSNADDSVRRLLSRYVEKKIGLFCGCVSWILTLLFGCALLKTTWIPSGKLLPVLLKFHRKSTFKLQGQKLDAYRKILDATRLQIPMALDFSDESTHDKLEQRWEIFSSILQHTPEFSFYTWAQQCRIQLFLNLNPSFKFKNKSETNLHL